MAKINADEYFLRYPLFPDLFVNYTIQISTGYIIFTSSSNKQITL